MRATLTVAIVAMGTVWGLGKSANAQVVDFSSLKVGTVYKVPAGTEIFKENNIPVALVEYHDATGKASIATAEVVANGTAKQMRMSGSCLNFDFSQLDVEANHVRIEVQNHAIGVNLSVNGSVFIAYDDFNKAPKKIKRVTVETTPLGGKSFGITLKGRIDTLVIGGVEVVVEKVQAIQAK